MFFGCYFLSCIMVNLLSYRCWWAVAVGMIFSSCLSVSWNADGGSLLHQPIRPHLFVTFTLVLVLVVCTLLLDLRPFLLLYCVNFYYFYYEFLLCNRPWSDRVDWTGRFTLVYQTTWQDERFLRYCSTRRQWQTTFNIDDLVDRTRRYSGAEVSLYRIVSMRGRA